MSIAINCFSLHYPLFIFIYVFKKGILCQCEKLKNQFYLSQVESYYKKFKLALLSLWELTRPAQGWESEAVPSVAKGNYQ